MTNPRVDKVNDLVRFRCVHVVGVYTGIVTSFIFGNIADTYEMPKAGNRAQNAVIWWFVFMPCTRYHSSLLKILEVGCTVQFHSPPGNVKVDHDTYLPHTSFQH